MQLLYDAPVGVGEPSYAQVIEADKVQARRTYPEVPSRDAIHGFGISEYGINVSLEPGETRTIRFVADEAGVFPFYCTEFCSALHLEMAVYIAVEPASVAARDSEGDPAAAGERKRRP